MGCTISFHGSAVSRDQLTDIIAHYMAVERTRVYRQLFVVRFGMLAAFVAVLGLIWLTPGVAMVSAGLCLVPPTWAWIAEVCQERRLARRIEATAGAHERIPA